jgi:hypothetical protein
MSLLFLCLMHTPQIKKRNGNETHFIAVSWYQEPNFAASN